MRAAFPSVLVVLMLAAPGLCACGGKSDGARSGEPDGPGHAGWKPTFDAAMEALERIDYRKFEALLTPTGRATLEQDLQRFSAMLDDPMEGSRTIGKIRVRWPEVPEALIAGAKAGRAEDAWTLFLRASTPSDAKPQQAGMKVDPKQDQKDSVQLLYRYGEGRGRELEIDLRRLRGQWYVDKIALGPPP